MKKSLLHFTAVAGVATLLGAGIAGAQDIYVTDQTSDQLTVIGPGGTLSTISNPASQTFLDAPTGIAVDNVAGSSYYGDVFVANNADGTIVTYNPTTNTFANFASGLSNPAGLAFDSNGNLYVANDVANSGFITQYSGTNLSTVNNAYSTNVNSPYGLTATGAGQLYVTLGNNLNLIQLIAAGGGSATAFTPTSAPNNPEGIVIGPNGDLYVVNNGTPNVEQIKVNGNSSVAVSSTGENLDLPRGLVFDANGNLYVTDLSNNSVTEYALTGFNQLGQTTYSYVETFSGAFDGPSFLAFDPNSQAVPEPGTYAMLFGGLAVLYVMQRRRSVATVTI